MNVIAIANTNAIPGKARDKDYVFIHQADPDDTKRREAAVRELQAIAAREGYTLANTVYEFARVYFYCQIAGRG